MNRGRFGAWLVVPAAGLGLALASAASFVSCNVYDTSLLVPASDAGPDGPEPRSGIGFWSGPADNPSSCFSARYPRPEDRPAAGNTGALPPIFMAFTTLNTGSLNDEGVLDPNAWKRVGFDLDGTCTGSETCETPGQTLLGCKAVAAATPLDGDYCRDNTFGRLGYLAASAPETATGYGLSSEGFNCALCVGAYNYLFRINGYNGEANDDRVRVDLYPSPGLDTLLPWDCRTDDWKKHPCFSPDDKWQIREDVLTGAATSAGDIPASKLFDENAYVRDSTLFLTIPEDTVFWFPGRRALATAFPLKIRKGFVTVKLERGKDDVWRARDGVIAGRATAADVIKGFRMIGVCEDDKNYSFVQEFVSKNVDVLASGARDPNTDCDAISLGLPFTAIQATPGKPTKVDDLVECQKQGQDGGTDAAAIPDGSGGADAASDGSADAGGGG